MHCVCGPSEIREQIPPCYTGRARRGASPGQTRTRTTASAANPQRTPRLRTPTGSRRTPARRTPRQQMDTRGFQGFEMYHCARDNLRKSIEDMVRKWR
jgi:hypothetical protein